MCLELIYSTYTENVDYNHVDDMLKSIQCVKYRHVRYMSLIIVTPLSLLCPDHSFELNVTKNTTFSFSV